MCTEEICTPKKDIKAIESRFRNIHRRDKDDIQYNRIVDFAKNLHYQDPTDVTISVLDVPYCITSITKELFSYFDSKELSVNS